MQETKTITYQPHWFQNRRLILGVLAVMGLVLLMHMGLLAPVHIVLGAQIILFGLLFRRPIWALAALIVGQFTASNYMFSLGGQLISVRFIWTILAILLLVPILRQKGGIKLGGRARWIIIPAVILFCIAIISNFVNIDLFSSVQYLRTNVTALVILFLLPAAVKNERDLKRLALVALITCSISAVIAVMQHYSYLGLPDYRIYKDMDFNGRIAGLSESPVQLGYTLPVVLLPMVALYLLKGVNSRARKLIILLVIIITAALYFTFLRSGIYSLAAGVLPMIFLIKGKPRKELFLVTLILFAGFLFYVETTGNRYSQGFSDDSSAAGRLVLWQAGVNLAMDHPILGIGAYRFTEMSAEYGSTVDPTLLETQGAGGALGVYEAHNDFITVWTSFGTVALLAFLLIFVGIFRNFLESYRKSPTLFLKGLSLGCCAALIAYIVNAASHNVMSSTMILWILGGLSIATTKVALSKQVSKVEGI